MARTGKWPARVSLALSAAMIATLFTVINASGQAGAGEGLPTVGIDVQSANSAQVTYAIVVRNQGTAPSTGARVTSSVPNNTTFESSEPPPSQTTTPSPGSPSCGNGGAREDPGTTCQWDLGTIPPGEARTISATYNLNQANIATYTVSITAQVRDNENHSNSDNDQSLTRARVDISDDTFVNDNAPPNTNYGGCNYFQVLQNNTITSFVESDSLPSNASIERLFGAQLRAEVFQTTYTEQARGSIGAHRITSAEWSQGSGACPGATSTNPTDARTGAEPTSAPAATGVADIRGLTAEVVNWNVTADLDDEADRQSFQGWELRDQASAAGDNHTRFHSIESTEAQRPRLFLVYTVPEAATCIDADPDSSTQGFGGEQGITAFVTDGDKIPSPPTATGPAGDACNGGPVATDVEWEVEDDDPDVYFSRQNGQVIPKTVEAGGDARPDSLTTRSDASGITTAGVREDDPAAGTNRIEVRIRGASGDPDPPPSTPPANPTCALPTPPPGANCSGETNQIDDVFITWSASATPSGGTASTSGGSPSGSSPSGSQSSSSPSGSQSSGSPSQSGSPSRSASSGSPSGSASSSSPQQSSRTVSLFADAESVVYPGQVTLSGQITSPDSFCEDAGEFVRIRRRILGQSEFTDFESDNTDADGRYQISFTANQSAEYVAVAPAHDQCSDASSSPDIVEVKVKITGRSGRRSVERGSNVGIVGRVKPDHDGTTVILQRRKGGRWVGVARDSLNVRSRYRFVLTAGWRGRRTFRVLWKAQDEEHARNNSKRIVIRTTRP